MFRLKLFGGALALFCVIWVVQKANHAINYVPAIALVTSETSECYLQKVENGVFKKTTETTQTMPCVQAERLSSSHPAYQGMRVKGIIDVAFDYMSPADKGEHHGAMKYAYEDYDKVALLTPGGKLPILVHKSDPNGVAHDYDDMAAFATGKK